MPGAFNTLGSPKRLSVVELKNKSVPKFRFSTVAPLPLSTKSYFCSVVVYFPSAYTNSGEGAKMLVISLSPATSLVNGVRVSKAAFGRNISILEIFLSMM
ncbi:hypothetical protein D3C80_1633330 [compost metagenome]